MRLLGITNALPPDGYGYGAICEDVMTGLAERGHNVEVLAARGSHESGLAVDYGLVEVPAPWRKPVAGRRAATSNERLLQRVLAAPPDAAIAWHMRGIGKGLLTQLHDRRVRVVYMLGDLWVAYEHPGPPALWRGWQRAARSSAYRTVSNAARRLAGAGAYPPIAEVGAVCFASGWLQQRYADLGFVPREAHVVPNGIRLGAPPASREPVAGRPARLAFVGRLDRTKGADLALKALAQIPEATLELVGGASARASSEAESLAAGLGIRDRVRFRGVAARDDALRALEDADVFLMPGRVDEAFGLVYLEAMARGAAVVGTALGGAAEICVHEENALVVPSNDHRAIAEATRRLMGDDALRARVVREGRATAEHYPLDAMVARVEEITRLPSGERSP